jgi:two-component system nitrate/nitrite response regulator NarL
MPGGTSSASVEDSGFSLSRAHYPVPAVPRVYIVCDVRLYREGLIANLAQEGRLDVLGVGCSADALGQIAALRPEVLLLDLAASDSLAIPHRALLVIPTLHVVAFAVTDVEAIVLACAEAGFCGYVARDGSVEDLVTAVLRALRGEVVCSPRISGLLFSRVATLSSARVARPANGPLTPREREIAGLAACGLRNKEIARRLRLGPTTIKNHVHNILHKLNVHGRGEIAGLELGWDALLADRTTRSTERLLGSS